MEKEEEYKAHIRELTTTNVDAGAGDKCGGT